MEADFAAAAPEAEVAPEAVHVGGTMVVAVFLLLMVVMTAAATVWAWSPEGELVPVEAVTTAAMAEMCSTCVMDICISSMAANDCGPSEYPAGKFGSHASFS